MSTPVSSQDRPGDRSLNPTALSLGYLRFLASDLATVMARPFAWMFWGASVEKREDLFFKTATAVPTLLFYGFALAAMSSAVLSKAGVQFDFFSHPRYQVLGPILGASFTILLLIYGGFVRILPQGEYDRFFTGVPVAFRIIGIILLVLLVGGIGGAVLGAAWHAITGSTDGYKLIFAAPYIAFVVLDGATDALALLVRWVRDVLFVDSASTAAASSSYTLGFEPYLGGPARPVVQVAGGLLCLASILVGVHLQARLFRIDAGNRSRRLQLVFWIWVAAVTGALVWCVFSYLDQQANPAQAGRYALGLLFLGVPFLLKSWFSPLLASLTISWVIYTALQYDRIEVFPAFGRVIGTLLPFAPPATDLVYMLVTFMASAAALIFARRPCGTSPGPGAMAGASRSA